MKLMKEGRKVEKQKKMKCGVMVRPRKAKEWIIGILMILTVLFTVSPFINLVNVPTLVLGLPALMWVALLAIVITIIVVVLAYKWEVH